MGWEPLSDVVRFALGPSFKVKRGEPKLKVLIAHLLLDLEVCNFTGFDKLSFLWIAIASVL